ncbi:MAG: linear amide C-N hydrolase [Spirochaetaceae bacterium]|nr:linear amide C-N hydrolase [Spirochaetaceae bacterium]
MKKSLLFGLILLVNIFLFAGCDYNAEMSSLNTLRKIHNGVFYIEYEGDYRFDEYIKAGGGKTNDEMADYIESDLRNGSWSGSGAGKNISVKITAPDFGCSSIAANNTDGGQIYGRNFDWNDCAIMIIHTKPSGGYESISTSCLEFLGLKRNWNPVNNFSEDIIALATIYVPLDGINEKGLYIADNMAGDDEQTAQNTSKPDVTTTAAIRLILDNAATVDEAIKLLEETDMYSVIGSAHHFAIADASGKSVVVEYVNNKMYVTETKVLTNHYTAESPKKDDGSNPDRENSRERFAKLLNVGEKSSWKMNAEDVRKAMESVSAPNYSTEDITAWSVIFEPEKRRLTYYFRSDFEKPFVLEF